MALSVSELAAIATELATRPGHEKVRTNIWAVLTSQLGFPSASIEFEKYIGRGEVTGRADALLGRTVFEFKKDLRRELVDAETQLRDYIEDREGKTGHTYTGVATDGAQYRAYRLDAGNLVQIGEFAVDRGKPRELVNWIDQATAARDDLDPEPEIVKVNLGRDSLVYGIARHSLRELWGAVSKEPDVILKRELWSKQLALVYGSPIDDDDLWFQHTFLTIVAKTMATAVLGIALPGPDDILTGKAFEDATIFGAVESDFFDWVLDAPDHRDVISRISKQVARFQLRDVQSDVLKGLYESLIDPETRHELGEYYTPDWLAQRICDRAIVNPLEQRVLDPACGSGTFLFHAIRRVLAAADAKGLDVPASLQACTRLVFGIDVHPVAAMIARVTYLLALGDRIRHPDRGTLNVPVYLGDAMQWNTEWFAAEGEVLVGLDGPDLLHFPASVATRPSLYDQVIDEMLNQSEQSAPPEAFSAWLEKSHGIVGTDNDILEKTYATLKRLYDEGRDHIWGYMARNLGRPVWLASTGQRAAVIVGNPPWLSYRFMSAALQKRFRTDSERRGLWAGGNVATHQDLSGLFFVRSMELYLQAGGLIAFVMPYAALSRKQFEGFRTGWYGTGRGKTRTANVVSEARFIEAWAFDEHLQPLFPVPSCVLFAEKRSPAGLPASVDAARGRLIRRDATLAEADSLTWSKEPWPQAPTLTGGSAYRERFRQGATLVPRRLCLVERVSASSLGGSATTPLVRGRTGALDKPPWKSLPPMQMQVEREFLRPVYMGESVAPFRLLDAFEGVIPWEPTQKKLLDSVEAQLLGNPRLAEWLKGAETAWYKHRSAGSVPTFNAQLDYYGKLSAQFPLHPLRLVYSKSGSLPAAAILQDPLALVDHMLYWAPMGSVVEAYFLCAVLNSETARALAAGMQSKGQWGARHFDKVMFELPIPLFDPSNATHVALATAGKAAEAQAATVVLHGRFIANRQQIRAALVRSGIAGKIEALVAQLLA